LISRSWTLTPGQQTYRCVRAQATTEMWISAFRSLSPLGTHHEVLTIDPETGPETGNSNPPIGEYDCDASSGTLTGQMMYAAGIDTDDLAFPSGVAIHLMAGQWMNLNLHLFDQQDNGLTGESGIQVKTVAAADVVNPADMEFSGTFNISIPPDGMPHTATGGCNPSTDWHVFALWPHMHQTGTHQTLTVTPVGQGATATTLLDTPFDFQEQKNYPMAETIVPAGGRIQTTCTYVNNTSATIMFGDSTTDEMCFTGIYKYPVTTDDTFSCVSPQ
jgi:hypothetical protein